MVIFMFKNGNANPQKTVKNGFCVYFIKNFNFRGKSLYGKFEKILL